MLYSPQKIKVYLIKKVSLLPNIITTFSLACGLFVIFKMSMVTSGMASYPILRAAAFLLLLAAIADVLDGATARLIRAESDFGVMFDSLSDAITFGVAPAVMTLKGLNLPPNNQLGVLASLAAMVFAVCGVLRLVRYSVHKYQNGAGRSYGIFTGLPIPAAAAAVVSATLLLSSPQFPALFHMSQGIRAVILSTIMFAVGYFMVSRWKFPGIKTLNIRLWSSQLLFLTISLAVILFYSILHYFSVVFFVLSWGYIACAWTLSLIRLIAGKRAKSLEDYEPASLED